MFKGLASPIRDCRNFGWYPNRSGMSVALRKPEQFDLKCQEKCGLKAKQKSTFVKPDDKMLESLPPRCPSTLAVTSGHCTVKLNILKPDAALWLLRAFILNLAHLVLAATSSF